MPDRSSAGRRRARARKAAADGLGDLLGEIEKEKTPARLLELALRLQAALVDRRRREADGDAPESGAPESSESS